MKALRNYILLLLLLMLAFHSATAQQSYDSSFKTTYYEQKVSLFRLLPDTKKEIVFLGNSITDIGEWVEIWNNKKIRNRGISGDNTFGVLARLDEVLSSKPAKLFIMIGINDIAKGTPDNIIIRNYNAIIDQVLKASPKTKLYVQSILPANNNFKEFVRHQNKEQHIKAINEALQNICAERSIFYVDLHSRFVDAEGKLDKQYTNDGLHINGYGYMLWKSILQEKGYLK